MFAAIFLRNEGLLPRIATAADTLVVQFGMLDSAAAARLAIPYEKHVTANSFPC
jgi:hypothetical protein